LGCCWCYRAGCHLDQDQLGKTLESLVKYLS
jgi:hypothetical protein